MKVEIERAVFDNGLIPDLMIMIDKAKKAESMQDFIRDLESTKFDGVPKLNFGCGGSHGWVSDSKGKRILLITNN